jgi:hypothetical protein
MSKEMFGMSESDIREQYMESITAKLSGLEMVVAGILSDCQEILTQGQSDSIRMQNEERVRKQLNVAKFNLLFRRNSQDGCLEVVMRTGSWGGLNSVLHAE